MKARVAETNEGIQGELDVDAYDGMQRRLRDRGWIETRDVIHGGITAGHALEVGPGPGYLGLEWLMHTRGTTLTAVEISPAMIARAQANAAGYGLQDRVRYVEGNAMHMPFADGSFDAVFTNGSLHEWEHPEAVFAEIHRVLKPAGRYHVSDLRRDMPWWVRLFLLAATRTRAMRAGLVSSLNASYTAQEIRELLAASRLSGAEVTANFIGICIRGVV